MFDAHDLVRVRPTIESRAISFENPTGARGAGGAAHGGRKGAPARNLAPGERVVLADVAGPGVVRHIWMTIPPAPPEVMRAHFLEVFYGDAAEPSISAPAVDFFGVPWGRPVHTDTALSAIQEGRGFNSFVPLPFRDRIRVELTNASQRASRLYYQIDYTLEPALDRDAGFLHVAYRRENPTLRERDFTICDGLAGPGRFLGCVVGVRVLDAGAWYGEGEVKMYLDGDTELPTICGTGLEDYVGTAWGMGPHLARYAGAPLEVRPPSSAGGGPSGNPDFVGFYRWHVPDPVVFRSSLRVTIQQIGFEFLLKGQHERMAALKPAGGGWMTIDNPNVLAAGIVERSDDYCATAFVLCAEPQPVGRVTPEAALADIERRPYESAGPFEGIGLALFT